LDVVPLIHYRTCQAHVEKYKAHNVTYYVVASSCNMDNIYEI